MASPYDLHGFIARVATDDLVSVIAAANDECRRAEVASFGVRGAPRRRAEGSVEYTTKLKQLLFLLQHGAKPGGVHPDDLRAYEPLVRSLVTKGQLGDSHLQLILERAP